MQEFSLEKNSPPLPPPAPRHAGAAGRTQHGRIAPPFPFSRGRRRQDKLVLIVTNHASLVWAGVSVLLCFWGAFTGSSFVLLTFS